MTLNARVWLRRIFGRDVEYNRKVREQRLYSAIVELGFDMLKWDYEFHAEQPGGKNRTVRISRLILKD